MNRLNIALILLLLLSSCVVPPKGFTRMSSEEIMAYNRTVEYPDQVLCVERTYAGSHIPRRECRSYQDIAEGRRGSLNTPSSSISIQAAQ